jgi:hypothetical protein
MDTALVEERDNHLPMSAASKAEVCCQLRKITSPSISKPPGRTGRYYFLEKKICSTGEAQGAALLC